jgi:hypothetical protein
LFRYFNIRGVDATALKVAQSSGRRSRPERLPELPQLEVLPPRRFSIAATSSPALPAY